MALTSPPHGLRPGDHLLVVHDFTARGDDELTLQRGEKIELVELDDGFGDGWYLGKDLKTGVTGLFPGVYTARAPNITVRSRPDALESDAPTPGGTEGPTAEQENLTPDAGDPVSTPRSEDDTPHASRHPSLTNLRAAHGSNEPAPTHLAPKHHQQQNRSSSSPLPNSQMAGDIQHSIRQTLDPHLNGQESPVMNETLSVIDEHITDLSTPRHSVKPSSVDQKTLNDSASEYSTHLDHRMSYINGHETDEEEGSQPSEQEVRGWSVEETVKQLRDLGLEDKHCDIFKEQEITGDVLLDMNQDFIMMKEFDFGVMGRRLKSWHKIKAFQEEIKGYKDQQSSTARGSVAGFSAAFEERPMSRSGQTGPLRPRIPSFRGSSSGPSQHPRLMSSSIQSDTSSPLTPQTPSVPFMDHTRRPSAASIREINHQRRHSSLDASSRYSFTGEASPNTGVRQKKGSFDRGWSMSLAAQRASPRPGTALGTSSSGNQHTTSDSAAPVTDDLDRGYFSGPETDTRAQRRFLRKRSSVSGSAHSLQSTDEQLQTNRRRSRISSVGSITDTAVVTQSPGMTHSAPSSKGRLRSLSTRITAQQSTRDSGSKGKSGGFFSSFAPRSGKSESDNTASSTPQASQALKSAAPMFRRAVGLRAVTDAIGKGLETSTTPVSPVHDTEPASNRTGSTISTSKSSERHSNDSGKTAEGGLSYTRVRPSVKTGVKSKKDTSAYTRGLEKKNPQEQIDGCDFSGWMKKRSSNLMTTWKPRLFVLRGRRLSYYYSENDTEERGLIDITAHRVLRADKDPIITLHATITGATVSPTSPPGGVQTGEGSVSENGASSEYQRGPRSDGDGPFFFKLVPPKSGSSRAVQFTKPAIHYFQVDSVKEGRLWMAALMKATIERDVNLPIETTNKQRTISLKEAQLMNQRPPTLTAEGQGEAEDPAVEPAAAQEEDGNGLMIQGLNVAQVDSPVDIEDAKRLSNQLGDLNTGSPSLIPNSAHDSG